MSNKNKEVVTPYSSFTKLVDCLDKALELLDEAGGHFELAVLPMGEVMAELDESKREEFIKEVQGYVLLANFLIDHPLTTVIRQIRDESKVNSEDTAIIALKHEFEVGQIYRHYKGTPYIIRQVSKDANTPIIEYITYQSIDNLAALELGGEVSPEVWTLPVHDFIRRVDWNGKKVNRFQYIPKELFEQDEELGKHFNEQMAAIFSKTS